ncbi:MAG: lipase secretion chaperone, partial [Myxococcota bacterium]
EARLRAEGASADDLTRLRQRRFGVEAAARLAVLDGRRASWERRVDAYRVERARRLAGTDEADRAAILDAVRTAHFPDPAERRRVAVLDRGGRRGAAD